MTGMLNTWDSEITHNCWPHEWELVWRGPGKPVAFGDDKMQDYYWCVVCRNCSGARCMSWTSGGGIRCEHVRHHPFPHMYPNGSFVEVGT